MPHQTCRKGSSKRNSLPPPFLMLSTTRAHDKKATTQCHAMHHLQLPLPLLLFLPVPEFLSLSLLSTSLPPDSCLHHPFLQRYTLQIGTQQVRSNSRVSELLSIEAVFWHNYAIDDPQSFQNIAMGKKVEKLLCGCERPWELPLCGTWKQDWFGLWKKSEHGGSDKMVWAEWEAAAFRDQCKGCSECGLSVCGCHSPHVCTEPQ